ncbi:ATP-dependent DNA helicase [Rubellimicrobium mesophilum DSM 19309]|uniref:ATP-dependent DNA helicase n=1 Tax=Rubellimicrobium mesophilum DSM 19309 TaxID=442562 RepID=A0A017HED5_9RHOB|nr:helicase-related protein [Rubellimicrobium mesophilum]EYD72139.1 ATP-dependent DNA helicase [Rubellimicrobium mesophilum DSM 19309]
MTPSRVTAVLGPTNTGKTHYAIERMLAHRTGIIGLPLRLLAREVYDRIVKLRGPSVVALVTGEERIVPDRAAYWVCTVEAMPDGMGADFLAVDEIQLCADPERGHVFTDRLLHARGLHETLFLGSETMRGAIAGLVPNVQFLKRERFSTLTYTGPRKISRMPERAAIVGFSVENVYAIAEFIRRTRGGAAVVMGALSPRTRNAQVELYQNGDVDFLVATDAIGMGLNLDIDHVAFSGLTKFDGHRMRELQPDELAQIAGRAGRHTQNGTFGVTGEAHDLDPEVVESIEEHQFRPVTRLMWRNSRLQFGSVKRLIQTLEERTDNPWLGRVRESDDLGALRSLSADAEVMARATDGPSVKLLWDVCRIPDFRGISKGEHAALLAEIYNFLHEKGRVPAEWLGEAVRRLDRVDGDIDTLSKRLAYIRTWTYVAQRKGWVGDEGYWRDETRAVEDRLSDALHQALTERFVDRRTSTLARRLRQREVLVAEVDDKGAVTVEGHAVGRLEGFRFRAERADNPDEARTLRQAAAQALAPQFHLRADRFYNAPDTEIDFTEQGGLMWGEHAVGRLAKGSEALKPEVVAFVDEEAGPEVAQKVQRRLQHFIDRKIAAAMEPLLTMGRDEALTGLAKGFAFRLNEHLGIIPRGEIAEEVKQLDPEARSALRKHGVRIGQFTVFLPALLKPAPTRLRLVLWSLWKGLDEFPSAPPAGHVTVPAPQGLPQGFWAMAGYRAAGDRAIRIDMLERLADMLRDKDSRKGFEAAPEMLSITGLSLEAFAHLMEGLGYRAEKAERPKVRAPKPATQQPGPIPDETPREAETLAPSLVPATEPAPVPSDMPQEPAIMAPPPVTAGEPDVPMPVEEPPPGPDTTPPQTPSEDPSPTPETPPGQPEEVPPAPDVPETPEQPPEPDLPPQELPVEEPPEEAPQPPTELPGSEPAEMPIITPSELPDITPAEMPINTPMEVPGSPYASAEAADAPAPDMTAPDMTAQAAEASAQPVEMESFYTFTWGGRAQRRPQQPERARSEGRPPRREGQPRRDGQPARADRPQGERPQGDRRGPRPERTEGAEGQPARREGRPPQGKGKPRGDRPEKGGPRPDRFDKGDRGRSFEAHPPREEPRGKRIDPDNPFAAALAGFKTK